MSAEEETDSEQLQAKGCGFRELLYLGFQRFSSPSLSSLPCPPLFFYFIHSLTSSECSLHLKSFVMFEGSARRRLVALEVSKQREKW